MAAIESNLRATSALATADTCKTCGIAGEIDRAPIKRVHRDRSLAAIVADRGARDLPMVMSVRREIASEVRTV